MFVPWVSTGPYCSDPRSPLLFSNTSFPSCGCGEGDIQALNKDFSGACHVPCPVLNTRDTSVKKYRL